ncbi:MAG: DUF3800 domain-containing protein [Deltaproteobacteria bacterium]|nr:DUF3800 domain-containing protein [Deltaproteobacteria bacterium]
MSRNITHIGFSDESHWNIGRFRSLALVTLPLEYLDTINTELTDLLFDSGLKEFKWSELQGARSRLAAEKICDFIIQKASKGILRVDVLIWDIQDRRHNIRGRDDTANLQRMYYHLFLNVLRERWPDDAVWRLYPDEHTAMKWQEVKDFLTAASLRREKQATLSNWNKFSVRLRSEFGIEEIIETTSSKSPLLQVADLFAGLAVFSREKYEGYSAWHKSDALQMKISEEQEPASPSKRDLERFMVLKHFDDACKNLKMGVSLKSNRGLWTPYPQNPINFWMYVPQHPADRAPRRVGKTT